MFFADADASSIAFKYCLKPAQLYCKYMNSYIDTEILRYIDENTN